MVVVAPILPAFHDMAAVTRVDFQSLRSCVRGGLSVSGVNVVVNEHLQDRKASQSLQEGWVVMENLLLG